MKRPYQQARNVRVFCSRLSQEAGEQVFGTAVEEVTLWLVLEYPRAWGARALEESALPPAVKTRLASWLEALPGARLQFIRQKERALASPGGITFYVSRAHEAKPAGYRFLLERYEDLLDLDLPALAAGGAAYEAHRHDAPLFLVCTNGRRDPCCAKWGRPVYRAATEAAHTGAAWQTTHTGGHRFAANLISLPHGICYGRLEPGDAAPLVRAHRQERLYRLDRYRGRSCYARPVQAADYFLREATRVLNLAAFRLLRAEERDGSVWEVDFAARVGDVVHRLRLVEELSTFARPLSCGGEAKRVPQYRLADHQVIR